MFVGLTFLVVTAIPIVSTKLPLDEDMFLYWRRSEPSECKPFTSYMVDCNKCVCSADGISYCTRMACFLKEDTADRQEDEDETSSSLFAAKKNQDDSKNLSPAEPEDSA